MYNFPTPSKPTDFFNASSQLCIYWLTSEIVIHDFVSRGEYLVSIFHSHSYMEMMYVRSGSGTIYIEDASPIELKQGSLIFLNASVPHKIVTKDPDSLHTSLLSFSLFPFSTQEKIAQAWIEDEQRIVGTVTSARFLYTIDNGNAAVYLDQLEKSAQSKRLGELVIVKNLMSSFLMSAFQSFTRFPPRGDFESALHGMPTLTVSKITHYIQAHFMENITINSVAESLFYSPRQCQRVIRECLGISFSDYLADVRLSHAKRLLRTTDDSVEKIAENSGFKSGKSFSRQLREREGITPYRYRKEHCRGANADAPDETDETAPPSGTK